MSNIVPYQDMRQMAEAMAKSKLFGMKTPDEVIALMLVAQANGQHPAAAARDYDIIQGRPSKKAEAMLRDFIAAGGSVQWHRLDNECADATFAHPQGGAIRIDWDMRRAKEAGLGGKEMYRKFPRQMLRSRCISEGVRTVYPVATGGLYAPEEVAAMPRVEHDMGAAEVVEPEMPAGLLEAAQTAAMEGTEAFRAYWKSASHEARAALRDHIPSLKAAAEAADTPPAEVIEAE
ncbi:MAG: hypothetical protein IT513_14405 [Burkholderiales bacterium]|nr:hypothetical protein [Burkholderiales bacterium]